MITGTTIEKSKMPEVEDSIFTTMSKMAAEYNAINLSQGFPDFNCPEELLKLVEFYQKKGYNQYAPMQGVLSLRKKLSEKILKLYGRKYNPETEIVITSGATEAIYAAITSVIFKDDEAIIFEPAYDSYAPVVISNGGKPVFIPLKKPDYSFDWNSVEKKISAKTKLIIINSPHNPTGNVISLDDLKKLEDITKSTNIKILSDEVYEHIVFDRAHHVSICQSEELSKRSFIISSFGKTYHTTGWKVGYCAAPENLLNEFKKLHQFIVFAVNTPVQYAYADFLNNESHYFSLSEFYKNKRDIFLKHIKKSKFSFTPAKSTYFQLLDYSKISEKNDINFAVFLARETGVAVIPLSPFYSNRSEYKIIRVCFAKNDNILIKAAEKLLTV